MRTFRFSLPPSLPDIFGLGGPASRDLILATCDLRVIGLPPQPSPPAYLKVVGWPARVPYACAQRVVTPAPPAA